MWHSLVDKLQRDSGDEPDAADGDEGAADFELTEAEVPVRRTDANAALVDALTDVIDPELGINIVDLGLVYALEADDDEVRAAVTATTPACPMSGAILRDVEQSIREALNDDRDVEVSIVWEPSWSPDFMSDRGKEKLGW
jgi:metal-sulfur cluster biosynthetic enzyme